MEFRKIQTIAFFALFIGVGILFYELISPYLFAIFWAAVISTIFHPLYRFIKKGIKNENISSIIAVILVLIIVLGPLAGVLGIVVKQAVDTYSVVTSPEAINKAQVIAKQVIEHPWVQKIVSDVNVEERIKSMSSSIASVGLEWLKIGSRNTATAVIQSLIMLYSLFYFFKDGPVWLRRLMHLLPFGDDNEKILYEKFASTSKATLKGTILLGGIQGTVGGILFFIVGIPSSAFWGLVMIVLSIIPAVGAFMVWFPAAIYFLVTGNIWQSVVLFIGGILIGALDNLLRPPLVGKDIQMHPIVILFSTIGGLAAFGISGVVVGPIIASLFMAIVEMYELKYKRELNNKTS